MGLPTNFRRTDESTKDEFSNHHDSTSWIFDTRFFFWFFLISIGCLPLSSISDIDQFLFFLTERRCESWITQFQSLRSLSLWIRQYDYNSLALSLIRLERIRGGEKMIFEEVRGKDKTRERNRRQKQEKESEGIDENSIRNKISIYVKGTKSKTGQ